MKILVSNDDGVHAPGIKALASAMSTFADVVVVAPDRNRSGASNSLTLTRPLRVWQLENGYYSVEGTPTDCVHLALTGLFNDIDLVVSGINDGANLGDDTLYSGTVAAAMEGRFLGLPSIAFSLVGEQVDNYEDAARIAKEIVLKLRKNLLTAHTILNVNIPNIPFDEIKGIQVTRLGARHLALPCIKQIDPRGKPIYWIAPAGPEADAGIGTDFHAIKNQFVSMTPLKFDMTHYQAFDDLATWTSEISWSV